MMYAIVVKPVGDRGLFRYYGGGGFHAPVDGRSRQPLFEACRKLKRMGADPNLKCAMYHHGSKDWAVRITIGKGAGLMVVDSTYGKPRFVKYYHPDRTEGGQWWH